MAEVATVVGPIPDQGFPIQCHQATLYWLFQARLGRSPRIEDYVECPNIIRRLAFYGQPVSRSKGALRLQPGTVLIYTGGANDHSCITTTWDKVGGYNQQGWFATGQASKYTEHYLSEIHWVSGSQVRGGNDKMKCTLYRVNEVSAQGNIERVVSDVLAKKG